MTGAERAQARDIVEHFNGKAVTNEVLKSFCERNKYTVITKDQFDDFVFQYEHDKRMEKVVPLILKELMAFKTIPELIGDNTRKKMMEENELIEERIARLIGDVGAHYNEIDLMTDALASSIHQVVKNAGTRVSNMCAVSISDLAKQTFGEPLTVKKLETYYEDRAEELGNPMPKKREELEEGQL